MNTRGKILMPQPKWKDADQQSRYIYAVDDGKTKDQDKMDKWDIVYEKDMPKDLTDGQWDRDFGFKVNKDFYIVSRMGRGRYIDLVSYDCKLKISNGRTSQRWYFDKKTKTIRSRKTTSYSLQIQSSGNAKKMVITSTSSRWW
jgi:hypothetical protein